MLPVKTLVVARYNEPDSWTDGRPAGWRLMIVQKDHDLPNEGREVSSFLWAMRQLHRDALPSDLFAFVQGDALPHCPDMWERLQGPIRGFTWLGDPHESAADGLPHHEGLPVREKHYEWTGREWPGKVWFAAGGQFAITGKQLKRHKPSFYSQLQKQMGQGELPWVMERLWGELFSA